MKIIFMGTPDFAAYSLKELISTHEVLCVVTQPDKPKGRKKELTPSPVKVVAQENSLKVYQPLKVKDEDFIKTLKAYKPDAIIVVAFGQIIPENILNIPRYGCINLHASLLPKYRGAAPIQWAIINGEKVTGVTSMLMDKGLDTGDILLKREIPIEDDETSESLFKKLMFLGSDVLLETLEKLEKGEITPQKQRESPTAYAKILKKSMGLIDFNKTAKELDCFIRGMTPWPSAYTFLGDKALKFWKAVVTNKNGEAGTIVEISSESFTVACKKGSLEVFEVQLEGKKRMSTKDFLNGIEIIQGTRFELYGCK